MDWNEEKVSLLRSLWAEGLSASQISARIPGSTRNAVISKVHRLGLSGRASPLLRVNYRASVGAFGIAKTSPTKRELAKAPKTTGYVEPESFKVGTATKTLMDLERADRCCRWPLPGGFCGTEALVGLSYCEAHAAKAYANWIEIRPRFVKDKVKEKETA